MDREHDVHTLYELALMTGGESRVRPLLTKMLQGLMARCAFSCGLFLSDFRVTGKADAQDKWPMANALIEVALGCKLQTGSTLALPQPLLIGKAALVENSRLLSKVLFDGVSYTTALRFPVPGQGVFLLFSTGKPKVEHSFLRLIEPLLKNFATTLKLCRANEKYVVFSKRRQENSKEDLMRFRAALDTSGESIFLIDPENMRFIDFNRTAVDRMGYSQEELLTMGPQDIKPEYDRDRLQSHFREVIDGSALHAELSTMHRCKDGTLFPVDVRLSALAQKHTGTIIIAVARDVTARRKAEQAQEQSEESYRHLVESANAIPWKMDMATMCFTYVGPQAVEVLGYPIEAWYEESFWIEHLHPDDREWALGFCKEHSARNINHNFEYRMRAADGSTVWIRDDVAVVFEERGEKILQGFMFDITERKQAEEELNKHRHHLEELVAERTAKLTEQSQIIDHIHDSVVLMDLNGYVTRWNRGAERLFGYSAKEAVGQHISFIYPDIEQQSVQDLVIAPLIRCGGNELEVRMQRKNGEYFYGQQSLSMLNDQTGKHAGIIEYSKDITRRKMAEEKLKRQTYELEAANKELEAFSYSVSHDLRAPLRHIDGFSQALIEDYGEQLDEVAKDYLQRVRDASQRMGYLIDDLLTLSRVTRREMSWVPVILSDLVIEIASGLQEQEPGRMVEFVVEKDLSVSGDGQLLRIALENLIGNAWKYTGKKELARIEFGSMKKDGEEIYYVRDNGAGFDMKYVDKLFEPFQRLHRTEEFEGTGIGLATVARVIHRHGGEIWAQAALENGATFLFRIGKGDHEK